MNAASHTSPAPWDPDSASPHPTLFGLPPDPDAARIHILPLPWEATCSYGRGTARGPDAIRQASHQLDLLDPVLGEVWRQGIHMHDVDPDLLAWSLEADQAARRLHDEDPEPGERAALIRQVDELSARRSDLVETWTTSILDRDRIPAILGGDHSSPLGAIRAVAGKGELSILHLDAHLDQREAYEGFRESHASIFYNVLESCPQVSRLLSVGIRDYCQAEWQRVQEQRGRVLALPVTQWQAWLFEGRPFDQLCGEALDFLGERVWISFDIDALSPDLCPHTGTPVPGGLDFAQATHLLHRLAASGKQVVGFDLCEVWGPSAATIEAADPSDLPQLEWDANVGARILYKLCGCIR